MGDPSLDVLRILDSLDEYLTLSDSLSSTLRQGWLDLAGARHAMGTSRVTGAVFDLKPHPAAATFHVKLEDESVSDTIAEVEEGSHITPCLRHPSFTLSKEHVDSERGLEPEGQKQPNSVGAELRCRVPSRTCEGHQKEQSANDEVQASLDAQVQKQRSKLLSVYGVLVSPKLRGAQISFERALQTIVDLANARARMMAAFERIERDMKINLK
ncbi:uncharacterized protein LOC116260101 [Nymphaea colorata]|nr:uncharacterized protein LOC116260101 [Nymphaea colorata]